MAITILTSIKLHIKITENSSQEQELAISFKSLALDIFKTYRHFNYEFINIKI